MHTGSINSGGGGWNTILWMSPASCKQLRCFITAAEPQSRVDRYERGCGVSNNGRPQRRSASAGPYQVEVRYSRFGSRKMTGFRSRIEASSNPCDPGVASLTHLRSSTR